MQSDMGEGERWAFHESDRHTTVKKKGNKPNVCVHVRMIETGDPFSLFFFTEEKNTTTKQSGKKGSSRASCTLFAMFIAWESSVFD